MEYKEKYERAKQLYKTANADQKYVLERLFPELKDLDDERIRENIKIALMSMEEELADFYSTHHTSQEEFLAWLEKQSSGKVLNQSLINSMVSKYSETRLGEFGKPVNCQISAYRQALTEAFALFDSGKCSIDKGELSDGYHTFNELYNYRMLYNAAFFNELPKSMVHKSKKHHDGEECFGGGWFIVMANLPTGQISNHYELKYWDLFKIPEKEVADEWDGHTPKKAADRLYEYLLEDKDQTNPYSGVSFSYNGHTWGMCARDNGVDILCDASIVGHLPADRDSTVMPEPRYSIGDVLRVGDTEYEVVGIKDGWYICDDGSIPIDNQDNYELVAKRIEPQQPHKFNINDYLVDTYCRGKVVELTEDAYLLDTGTGIPFSCEDQVHLWTIDDAKDGDVLVNKFNQPFIYNGKHSNGKVGAYGGVHFERTSFCKSGGACNWTDVEGVKPASVEKYSILFKKMELAGYKWDPLNKSLTKC